jgi:hypothetical protein
MLLDNASGDMSILKYVGIFPQLTHNMHNNRITEVAIKVWMPRELYDEMKAIANGRRISLSALIRLALSHYIKANK